MTVSDVLRAGGGLAQQALSQTAELARYEVRDGQTRQTEVIKVDLARVLAGDPTADLRVAPFDILMIKAISEWAEQESVRLEGEVRFPGDYPIQRGETLHSVIRRAGGLTALAYPAGSVFTRELLKERERVQIRELADKFQQDLASLALQSSQGGTQAAAGAAETLALGQSMLKDLKATQPLGRLVIDLDRVLAGEPESGSDVILKDGDRLIIPQKMQEVTVLGEVQNATSFFYDPSLSKDDYVAMAGGTTRRADEGRSYVVRANGGIAASKGNNWFKGAAEMQPGDTIVVPIDAERMRPLPLWTQVTTIIYNMAVAVAAIGSL
jgi:protein involved in polysaccharide export with SLBB domain